MTQSPSHPDSHAAASSASSQSSPAEDDGSFQRLFRRIALLSSGATLSHIILLAFSPVLTRVYGPADFATYGFYQSVLAILSLALTLQFEQAIALPKSDQDAETLHRLSIRMGTGFGLLLTLVVLVLTTLKLLQFSWLAPLVLVMLPLCALGEAFTRTHRIDAVRYAHFRPMAMSRLTMSVGTVIGQLTLAAMGLRGVGLALGDGIGRWLSAIPLYFSHRKRRRSNVTSSSSSMSQLAKTYSKFPLLLTPAAMITLFIVTGPALILPGLFGEEFAGQFNLANRCVLLPMMIISQAVTHVFVSDASRYIREQDNRLTPLMQATAKRLACIGLGMAVVAAITAPFLFPFLFGSQWVVAGEIVPVVAIAGFSQFVSGPINQTLVLMQEEARNLITRVLGALTVFGAIYGTYAIGGTPMQAVLAYVVAMCLFGLAMNIQAFRCARRQTQIWETNKVDAAHIPLAA